MSERQCGRASACFIFQLHDDVVTGVYPDYMRYYRGSAFIHECKNADIYAAYIRSGGLGRD